MNLHQLFSSVTLCACMTTGIIPISSSAANASIMISEPSSIDLQFQLVKHYLIPDALCAAGVPASHIDDVVFAATTAIEESWDELVAAESALLAAQEAAASLKQLIARGEGSEQVLAEYTQAQADLADATHAHSQLLASIDAALLAQMGAAQQDAFLSIRSNQSRGVPMKYMVLDQTEEEWLELRRALAEMRTSDSPSSEAQQVVGTLDSSYNVNLAKAYLDSSRSTVKAAYDTALQTLGE